MEFSLNPNDIYVVIGCLAVLFGLIVNPWRSNLRCEVSTVPLEGGPKGAEFILDFTLIGGTTREIQEFAKQLSKNPPKVVDGKIMFAHNDRMKLDVTKLSGSARARRLFGWRVIAK